MTKIREYISIISKTNYLTITIRNFSIFFDQSMLENYMNSSYIYLVILD